MADVMYIMNFGSVYTRQIELPACIGGIANV